jgi:hypothetical protein
MKKTAAILAGLVFSTSAFASMMTFDVRSLEFDPDTRPDYATAWDDHSSPVSSTPLAAFTGIKSGNNSFSRLNVAFELGAVGSIAFQFGLDAGYGAQLFFDGTSLAKDTSDLWWSTNWAHPDVLEVEINPLVSGDHVLDLYWAENCCNGPSSGRFSVDGGSTWQALSTANLDAAKIPEPTSIAVLLAGLAGLGFARRVRNNA